ncbi:MAG: insulinase family protein [Myxococcota bacterium]
MLLALLPLAVARPSFAPDIQRYRFEATDHCFASGLRMVVAEDRRQATVTVTLVVDGGRASDPPRKEGVAELLHDVATLAGEGLGALQGGGAHPDVTTFVTLAPAADLERVLALQGQRLVDPLAGLTPTSLEAARVGLEDALWARLGTAPAVVGPLYTALFPKEHPYHRAFPSRDAIAELTAEDLRAAAARWYHPANATLHVTGDVDDATAHALAARVLPAAVTSVPEGAPPVACASRLPHRLAPPPARPSTATPREVPRIVAAVASPTKVYAWSLPAGWGEDDVLGELAVEALRIDGRRPRTCGRIRGRLASMLWCVEPLGEEPPANWVPANWVPAESGVAQARALAEPRVLAAASVSLLRRVLWEAELSGHPFEEDGAGAALAAHLAGAPTHAGALLDALGKVDPRRVTAFAENWLTPERSAGVVLVPATRPGLVRPAAALAAAPVVAAPVVTAPPDLAGADLARPDLAAVRSFVLPTGLRVVVWPFGQLPRVHVRMDFRGGALHETTPGISALLAEMEIFAPRNIGFGVTEALGSMGARQEPYAMDLHAGLTYEAFAGNLDAVLFFLRLRLDGVELAWQDRGDFVENQARRLHEARQSAQWWAAALSSDRLFPGHPVSLRALDDDRLLVARATTDAQVAAWRDRVRHPANATLHVVGNVDPAAVEALVARRLGGWKGRGRAPTPLPTLAPPPPPPARQVLLLGDAGKAFSTVRATCQVDGTSTPETLDVVDLLVSERVAGAWRRSGWSHDADAVVTTWEGGAAGLRLRGMFAHDRVGDALLAARALLDGLATLAADDPDVRRHLAARTRTELLVRFTGVQALNWLTAAWRAGWPESASAQPARLAAVTGTSVARALAPCVGHEVFVVSGPYTTPAERAALDEQASRIGVPVEVYDWRGETERRWVALDPDGANRAR